LNNKQLWKISKYSYYEAFLQSNLDMMGFNQAKFIENMEKNTHYLKMQEWVMKIVVGIYIGAMVFLPIQAFQQLLALYEQNMPIWWLSFSGTIVIGLYFALQMVYLIVFGMFFASGMLNSDCYNWLSTLPLKKDELRKIVMLTFFRGVDVQFFVMTLVLPIATAIATKNILLVLITIGVSLLNVYFAFAILIIIGGKLNRIMKNADVNSRKNNFIRILALSGYIIGILIISIGLQLAFSSIGIFFSTPRFPEATTNILNFFIPLIPFPFNSGAILTNFLFIGMNPPMLTVLSTIIGLGIFLKITKTVYTKAKSTLDGVYRQLTHSEPTHTASTSATTLAEVHLSTTSKVQAFFNRDKHMATRDFQIMMLMIMPIILPLLMSFSMIMAESNEPMTAEDLIYMAVIMGLMYQIMGAMMLVLGLMNIETSGQSIMASLPIIPRDQALAKLKFPVIILPISSAISILMSINSPHIGLYTAITLLIAPIGPILALALLELKVALFGKMKYKYVLEEINFKSKILKWIVIIGIGIVVYTILIALIIILLEQRELGFLAVILILIETVLFGISYLVFNKMFPKK
jgi:predicted permease